MMVSWGNVVGLNMSWGYNFAVGVGVFDDGFVFNNFDWVLDNFFGDDWTAYHFHWVWKVIRHFNNIELGLGASDLWSDVSDCSCWSDDFLFGYQFIKSWSFTIWYWSWNSKVWELSVGKVVFWENWSGSIS